MSTIYIIKGESGQYSDHGKWNICAAYTEERAKELVDKITRLYDYKANDFNPKLLEWRRIYQATHKMQEWPELPERPKPTPMYVAMERICAYGKGTPEEKQHMKQLIEQQRSRKANYEAEYNRIGRLRAAIGQAYDDEMKLAERAWKDQNYNPPTDLADVAEYVGGVQVYVKETFSYEKVEIV